MTLEPYLTTEALADRYGLRPETIRGWRKRGVGPIWYEVTKMALPRCEPRIRYRLADVLAFEEANSIIPLN